MTRPSPEARRREEPGKGGRRGQQDTGTPELLRARYLKIALRDPSERFALERLLALYRERDGNLDGLAKELAAGREPSYALWLLRAEVEAARGNADAARAAYRSAAGLAPSAAEPWLGEAELEQGLGALGRAAELLRTALDKTHAPNLRAQVLARMAELALAQNDFDAAERCYAELAKLRRGGPAELSAYARALAQKGEHARAVVAYKRALEQLRGDNRVLPPVLLELARSELELGDGAAALETLARARALAARGSGTRHELDAALVESLRRLGRLAELPAQLGPEATLDAEASELLGRVYLELGDQPRAIAALRRAVAKNPRLQGAREQLIRILSQQGELDQAIAEYRALLAAAPGEARFAFELAKLLAETGRREQALALLETTERRFASDPRALRSLFELYARIGERVRANAVLARLSRLEPEDPSHFVALGEERLEQGDQPGALAIWRKILDAVPDKARAHAALAATYLDHDMPERALLEYEAAVRAAPREVEYVRGLAETLERLQRSAAAAERWQEVIALSTDRTQKREARRRVAQLWSLSGELPQKVAELERAFGWPNASAQKGTAPDVEAGRFLAECYRALANGRRRGQGDPRYLDLAERALARVLELEKGDIDSMIALERLLSLRGKLPQAIELLSRLVEADPKHASEYLGRMAAHALAIYRDEDAIGYAERLVALNPSDAKAHERLADLYRARQDRARAIASYERALALDEDAFPVALSLAELYLSGAEPQKAERVLLRVVRGSLDDELVKRAARSLIQLEIGESAQRALEQWLLPLALGNPERPVFRAMLVELYDGMTRPLIDAAREPGADGNRARSELRAIGQRAIQPLLAALADNDPAQRRIAIELLGQLQNEHAAAALLAAAERDGDVGLRRRALLSAGEAATPALAGRFATLAAAPERRLRDAAAWALARMAGPSVLPELRGLLVSNTPAVRAYALVGLSRLRDRASREAMRQALRADRSPLVRAVAALALGLCEDRASSSALTTALWTEQAEAAAAVAIGLGLLGERAAGEPLAEALFTDDAVVRRAALWSLRFLAHPASETPQPMPMPELPEPDDQRLELAPWLAAFFAREPAAPVGTALASFAHELHDAAEAALRGPPENTRVALALLSGADPLLAADDARPARALLVDGQKPVLAMLARHPDAAVRAGALALLASRAAAQDANALLAALGDTDTQVQSAALERVGAGGTGLEPPTLARVAEIARSDARWWMRLRAVAALGRTGGEAAIAGLVPLLASDAYAYVREAVATALGATGSERGVPALAAALEHDVEPRVRVAAARALARIPGLAARAALERMDAATRAALESSARN